MERVSCLASQNPVVIFSKSSCCMYHATKRLFYDLAVNPAIYELDEMPRGREIERVLVNQVDHSPQLPIVYIGGELIGSTKTIMERHLQGDLVNLLKGAGAILLI